MSSTRSTRRRSETETQKTLSGSKVTTRSPSVSAKKDSTTPTRKRKIIADGEQDIDPWLETSDWSRLFNPITMLAIKSSKTREEWEIKVVVAISELFLHCRHVPGHRIPEVLGLLQPTTPGVVHAASERPFFERKMKELQTELSFIYETVCKMILKTAVGQEFLEAFKKSKRQKHKPKWLSAEVIDSAITITDVELCAFWAPLSLACGSGWFLDEHLKTQMVSFVSTMRRQSYWMLARYMRALILTMEDDGDDVSSATRQEIFLMSSKMDLLPGFPEPNGGYPKSVSEWMSLSSAFRSGIKTGEMVAFMRRYNYKTEEMIAEEEKEEADAALAAQEAALAAEEAKAAEEAARNEEATRSALELVQVNTVEGNAAKSGEVALGDSDVTVFEVTNEAETTNEIRAKGVESDKSTGGETGSGCFLVGESFGTAVGNGFLEASAEKGVVVNTMMKEVKGEGILATVVKEESESESESSNSESLDEAGDTESEPEDSGEDAMGLSGSANLTVQRKDYATAMSVKAGTYMSEEEFWIGASQDKDFQQRLREVKAVLELNGVRHWMDDHLERVLMSGPVGISSWAMRLLGQLRQEFKRATVMIKQLDKDVVDAIEHMTAEKQAEIEAEKVWKAARLQFHENQASLSSMRKDELKTRKPIAEVAGGLFGSGGGKRRSLYGDDRKGKKKARVEKEKGVSNANPFEHKRVTHGRRSETLE